MHLASSDTLAWRAVLSALLVAACVTDLRVRRIPNALVLTVFGAALVRATLTTVGAGGATPGVAIGPELAAMGALCGLALWLPLYAVGALGAGDVKLFAAAAAWIGPAAVPSATLYAAVAGGALGLVWFGARWLTQVAPALAPQLHQMLQPTPSKASRVPYGVAITAGVLGVVWGNR